MTSSAGAVLVPTPKVAPGHEFLLAAFGMLAVVILLLAAVMVDPAGDDAPSRTPSGTTEATYQSAPPIHRLGPAQPVLAR
jgi:hypothetical protein